MTDGESETDGIWATEYVPSKMLLFSSALDQGQLASYINNNKKEADSAFTPSMLSRTIIDVSHALGLDQNVIAAQIQMESTFDRDAVSRTNAVGYMQFTTIGYQECADQLGARGSDYAKQKAVDFFRGKAIPLYENLSGKKWTDPWQLSDWRSTFRYDGVLNVICGGIVLKTFLSQTKSKAPSAGMQEVYAKSLEDYNGETAAIKAKYRSSILGWAGGMAKGGTGSTDPNHNDSPAPTDGAAAVDVQFIAPKWEAVVSKSMMLQVAVPPGTAKVEFMVQPEGAATWYQLGAAAAPFSKWWGLEYIDNGNYVLLANAYDAAGKKIGHRYNKVTVQK